MIADRLVGSEIVSMREDFNLLLDLIRDATAALDAHYFQLPVAELEDVIYRERVYCYELYH